MSPSSTTTAGAVTAGIAVAGAALFAVPPAAPMHPTGLPYHRAADITLVSGAALDAFAALPQPADAVFNSVLKFFLDLFGIGQQSVAHALDPTNTTTIESLLNGLDLNVDSPLSTVFDDLGLNNFTIASALAGLGTPTSDTVDQVLERLGVASAQLDALFTVVGLNANTTIAQLVNQMSLSDDTVAQFIATLHLGGQADPNMLQLLESVGLGKLDGLLPLLGMRDNTSLTGVVSMLGADPDKLTLGELLAPADNGAVDPDGQGFLSTIGGMTLGQLLGFNSATTFQNVVDNIAFENGTLGQTTLAELLVSANVDENQKLGDFLSSLQIGPDSSPLGDTSIAEVLDLLLYPPNEVRTVAGGVTDISTVQDYLSSIGLDNITVDQFLGLAPPDIPDSSAAVSGLAALLSGFGF